MRSSLKLAACLAVFSGLCTNAQATTHNLGPLTAGVPASFFGSALPGTFTDYFTFSVPVSASSSYASVNAALNVGPTFNTVLNTMQVFLDPNGIINSGDETLLGTSTTPGNTSLSLVLGPNAAGNIYLTVAGLTNGSAGGLYAGAINITPVPEPEAWGMLLAGLSLMGTIVRRRTSR